MKYATQAISRIQIVHEYNTQEFEARQHEDELNRTKKDRIAAFAWAIFAHSLFWLILFSCNGFGTSWQLHLFFPKKKKNYPNSELKEKN